MITFEQFLKTKRIVETDEAPPEIMKAATDISKKNKKAVIGATEPQELSNIMKDKSAMNLVKVDPKNAGKLGQVFTGLDAKEVEKQQI
jgi:hypothetical protein